jgi:hypothetical protein
MLAARQRAEWLSQAETSGLFRTMAVLIAAFLGNPETVGRPS